MRRCKSMGPVEMHLRVLSSLYNHRMDCNWREPTRIIKFSSSFHTGPPENKNRISERIVQMLLELRHAWCHDCVPGEPVSVPVHLLEEEPFPNTEPNPSLIQLPAVPSGPTTITREERSALPFCSKSEEAVGCHEASTQTQNSIRVG